MEASSGGGCPRCGGPVALAAVACPQCRHDLRVDLWVDRPLPPREAYTAARALEEIEPGGRTIEVKRALESGGVPVLRGVSAERAARAGELIASHGAEPLVRAHQPAMAPAPPPVRTVRLGWWLGGAAAAIALAWWLWPRTPPPASTTRANAATAPSASSVPATLLSPRGLGEVASAAAASLRCADSLGSGF